MVNCVPIKVTTPGVEVEQEGQRIAVDTAQRRWDGEALSSEEGGKEGRPPMNPGKGT